MADTTEADIVARYAAAARLDDHDGMHAATLLIDHHQQAEWERLTRPGALRAAALYYAERGLPVFPCKPGGKTPLTPNGFKNATVDADQIDAWWTRWPDANIGTPTGILWDAVDVDVPDGWRTLANDDELFTEIETSAVGIVHTPSGGAHYLVPPEPGSNGANRLPGIDFRAAGGYIIAPPSRIDDRLYTWTDVPAVLR